MSGDAPEFTTADLVARLSGPHPEQWTDVIAALARRTLTALPDAKALDAAAIVGNLAHTVGLARDITAAAIESPELSEALYAEWEKIREHLDRAAEGLGWISAGWI